MKKKKVFLIRNYEENGIINCLIKIKRIHWLFLKLQVLI